MTNKFLLAECALLFTCLTVVACEERKTDPPKEPAAVTPAQAPTATAAPAASSGPAASAAWTQPPPKADSVDAAALKAGLTAMSSRKVSEKEAIAKIEAKPNSRYFLHPGEDKNAFIEFSTKGLQSLELAPYIEDFGDARACYDDPIAGVAQLTWTLEGGQPNKVMVDRNYNGTVKVNVGSASKLKLEVDRSNGTAMCDWLSVGFLNVK